MVGLCEIARAKINLTLRVLGRRRDGFHQLDSLVAFAGLGDTVIMAPGKPCGVSVFGPFASAIVGENLVSRAIASALAVEPALDIGHIAIEKLLPVAAGIGGGSADAAAALRLIKEANPRLAERIDWQALAAELGSDVPVCFSNQACHMAGRGDILTPVAIASPLPAVLVNPRVPVPADKTRQVFTLLEADPLAGETNDAAPPINLRDWVKAIETCGNDLEKPASSVVPAIAEVLRSLRSHSATRVARLSGAGPTCFALTATAADADHVAQAVSSAHPDWWVRATSLS